VEQAVSERMEVGEVEESTPTASSTPGSEASSPSEVKEYRCPVCGKAFDSEKALKVHVARAHSKRREKAEETEEAEAPETLPTLSEQLSYILKLAGLNDRMVSAVLEIVQNTGFTLYDIEKALSTVGVSYDRKKLILQLWSLRAGEPIPRDLAVRYGLFRPRDPALGEWDEYYYGARPMPNPASETKAIEVLGQVVSTLLTRVSQPQAVDTGNNGSDTLVKELLEANKLLQQQVLQLQEQLVKKDLDYLSRELERIKTERVGRTEYDLLAEALRNMSSKTDKLLSMLERIVESSVIPIPKKYEKASTDEEILDRLEEVGLVE